MQTWLTVLIVACSALYVGWTLLLPSSARRALASRLLRLRWPKPVATRLRSMARASGSCGGCDGCGPSTPADQPQPMRWLPPRGKR